MKILLGSIQALACGHTTTKALAINTSPKETIPLSIAFMLAIMQKSEARILNGSYQL
jgi:hypothetical protein